MFLRRASGKIWGEKSNGAVSDVELAWWPPLDVEVERRFVIRPATAADRCRRHPLPVWAALFIEGKPKYKIPLTRKIRTWKDALSAGGSPWLVVYLEQLMSEWKGDIEGRLQQKLKGGSLHHPTQFGCSTHLR